MVEALQLLESRQLEGAIQAFDRAEGLGADADRCAGGRWQAYMLQGEMSCAWAEADAIRRRGCADPHRFWDGSPLRDRIVMVRCLHGLGDAVQMFQYLPLLLEVAHAVVVEVPPRLLALVREMPAFRNGRLRWITWGAEAPQDPCAWDVQVEVMELPYAFRTELPALPLLQRYIEPPAADCARVAAVLGERSLPRMGLTWTAGDWNADRAIPPERLRSLLRARAEVWSLAHGAPDDGLRRQGLRDASACGDGVLPLAAVIANMDLVLSTDTLVAHLAGAMGKPVWLLLQFAADWRWMSGRDDSPWYPTLRIFRQPRPGDWSGLVIEVEKALRLEGLL